MSAPLVHRRFLPGFSHVGVALHPFEYECNGPGFFPKKDDHSGEAAIFQRILNRVRFENDGTSVEESEAVILIQSEAGVRDFGQLVFGCSGNREVGC